MKSAFTLAEVLITLGIIGVVAAMALPTLLSNVNHRVAEARLKVANAKIAQAVELMGVKEELVGLANTQEFINKLQNHLAIVRSARAGSGKQTAASVFGYDEIHLEDGGTVNLTETLGDANKLFHMNEQDPDGNEAEYTTPSMAFIMNDGTYGIISYNAKCQNDGKETRNCYVALIDTNGKKSPNTMNQDIFLINAKGFGASKKDDTISNDDTKCKNNQCKEKIEPPIFEEAPKPDEKKK